VAEKVFLSPDDFSSFAPSHQNVRQAEKEDTEL